MSDMYAVRFRQVCVVLLVDKRRLFQISMCYIASIGRNYDLGRQICLSRSFQVSPHRGDRRGEFSGVLNLLVLLGTHRSKSTCLLAHFCYAIWAVCCVGTVHPGVFAGCIVACIFLTVQVGMPPSFGAVA